MSASLKCWSWDGTRESVSGERREHDSESLEQWLGSLHPTVRLFATGWQTALSRPPRIKVDSLNCQATPPAVVSVSVNRPRLKTISLAFHPADPPAALRPRREPSAAESSGRSGERPAGGARQRTRVAPPGDIVKLEDRLFYLLQPPLESLLHNDALELPFEPFPYQYAGIAFLYPRYAAILADEMGLGKTMQAITTIRLLLCSGELRNVLLICPKPLVSNWQREFALWAPEIAVGIIQGDKPRRDFQWRQERTPVKIANYELLMRDREVFEDERLHFDLVVLDEAQRIKNRSSTTSQVVRSISRSRSWALTGTPVENSTEDLVGICEFLSPGYLHSGMPARQMGEAISDFVLRRTKDMVLTDLPPKMYRDAELDLTPEQWASYKSAEDEGVVQLSDLGQELTIQHVFELVLRLKQICNFDPATGSSSKLERLEADLEEVAASGQKAIVFSQWVATLDQMRGQLRRFGPLEYHGGIPSRRRDEIIRTFRESSEHHVLLMSYGAGAVGLNLQFCGYVFLFDRWWNPAVEDQAINRAHRIGASGPVTVTRMLTRDTIEERINQVLEEKRQLFQNMFLHTGKPQSAGLNQDEIFGLFNLKTPRRSAAA